MSEESGLLLAACTLGSGFCHSDLSKVNITRDTSVVKYWEKIRRSAKNLYSLFYFQIYVVPRITF